MTCQLNNGFQLWCPVFCSYAVIFHLLHIFHLGHMAISHGSKSAPAVFPLDFLYIIFTGVNREAKIYGLISTSINNAEASFFSSHAMMEEDLEEGICCNGSWALYNLIPSYRCCRGMETPQLTRARSAHKWRSLLCFGDDTSPLFAFSWCNKCGC